MKGYELKNIIKSGLVVHGEKLTLDSNKVLCDFADKLDENAEHDLFQVFAELTLKSQEDTPAIVANLMTCATFDDTEWMDKNLIGTIGHFFRDTIKKEAALKYLAERS